MSDSSGMEVLPSDHSLFDPVRQLLKDWTLGAFLRRRPPCTVVTLSACDTCTDALRTFATHHISSAPVFDEKTCIGFVSADAILRALLAKVNVRELTEENREYRLRAAGLQLEHQQLRSLNLAQDGALIYKADLQSTLHDVLLYGFLQPSAAGNVQVVHRVGVFDADEDASDDDMMMDPEGPGLRGINVTHVVSQSDVVQFLSKHIDDIGPLADVSIQQLGLATKAVVCVPGEMSTVNAFASMLANKVSCVGVISHAHGGGLTASLSSSDLQGLLPDQFVSLGAPVLQYLTAKASAGWPVQQLQLQHVSGVPMSSDLQPHSPLHQQRQQQQQQQQENAVQSPQQQQHQQHQQHHHQSQHQQQHLAGSAHAWGLKGGEGLKPLELVSVSVSSSLRSVLELMASHRLHRLHVLDERSRPVGIVTITDLLRVIIGATELLEAYGPDFDELEQEVEQQQIDPPDCSMGVDIGHELIEPMSGLVPVRSSHALINTAV